MENKNVGDINRNNYIEYNYNNGSSLDRMLNDYYQVTNESNELITHSNIAHMNQVVVSTSDKPIIGTQALDTCFGILLYDRKNKFGICGHASPKSIFGIVVEMLKQIPSTTEGNVEYAIIPGYRAIEQHNFKDVEEIQDILRNYMSVVNPKIHFTSLKTPLNPSMPNGLLCYDFAFDTISGKDITSIVFKNYAEEQRRHHI